MIVRDCVQFLKEHDNYLILTHAHPDGDTLGCAGALCSALRRAGKTAWVYPNEEATEKYLPHVGKYFAPTNYSHNTVVSVDTAESEMLAHGFNGEVDFAIDHHGTNSGYAAQTLVCPDYAACGELLMEIILELCGDVSREEADLLYIAVSTDTGCFLYRNTNAHALYTASKLVEYGAENGVLNEKFFRSTPKSRIMLESMVYQEMKFYRDDKIAIAFITQGMIDASGVEEKDMDDLANLAGRPEGVIVSVTIKEKGPAQSKISLRSTPEVNVSNICAKFGGGGHTMAAGCTIAENVYTAADMILAAINEEWPQ